MGEGGVGRLQCGRGWSGEVAATCMAHETKCVQS